MDHSNNWRDDVVQDAALVRPTDLAISRADPARARARLDWRPSTPMPEVARAMVEAARV